MVLVVLTLSREIDEAEAVTVSYLPAAMHPLEDTSLNPVPALTGIPVRRTETIPSIALFVTSDALSDPEKIEILDISANGFSVSGSGGGFDGSGSAQSRR